jgi:ATP adenylyltransferase
MQRIFSPWRNAYVTSGAKPAACVFCAALAAADAADSLVVHVTPLSLVLMNLYPYSSGHVMIAPRRHVARLQDASDAELAELMELARRLERLLGELYRPEGLNVGMNLGRPAGAGVADHIHLHVVPRWVGDANFMTVVADTRVIPEDPRQACLRLRALFEES